MSESRAKYQSDYHAKNPDAAKHRKSQQRERMRAATFYAKFKLLHGKPMPEFVDAGLINDAMKMAIKELNLQNVTTIRES